MLSTYQFDAVWFMNFSVEFFYRWTLWIGTDILSLILRIQDLNLCWSLWRYNWYCVVFELWNTLLEFGCFTNSMVGLYSAALLLTQVLRIWDFFWRSGLWEYQIQLHAHWHCLSGLGRCWTHPASWLHLSFLPFRGHWPYQCRSDNLGCPGLMLDHSQPIPDAKYLPFYPW